MHMYKIKEGKTYSSGTGIERKVYRIVGEGDNARVIYTGVKRRNVGLSHTCNLLTFARWAKREVAE